jgi:hypothetical protein
MRDWPGGVAAAAIVAGILSMRLPTDPRPTIQDYRRKKAGIRNASQK